MRPRRLGPRPTFRGAVLKGMLRNENGTIVCERCTVARNAVTRMRGLLGRMEAADREDDLDALQELSLDFWDVLVRGSANIAYQLAFNTMRTTYDKIKVALVQVMADENRDLARMKAIVDAVARKDENAARKAAAALVEHGTASVLELIEVLRAADGRRDEKAG